jgi:hypothetical protein
LPGALWLGNPVIKFGHRLAPKARGGIKYPMRVESNLFMFLKLSKALTQGLFCFGMNIASDGNGGCQYMFI